MARRIDPRELLCGIEGLALLRHLYDRSDEEAARRLEELGRLLREGRGIPPETVSEAGVRDGYGLWSRRYDDPGNPIVALEEPAVWSLLEERPPGRALDAACGTGRHASRLLQLGHEVTAFDLTRDMLALARERAVGARLVEADLRALPLASGHFDLAVCGLALAHIAHLRAATAELGRVLARGGRLVVSVLHPVQAWLGWQAPFADELGHRRFVREHPHTHGSYLGAFREVGLELARCLEPALTEREVRAKRRAWRAIPEAALAAYEGMPAVLVLELEKRS